MRLFVPAETRDGERRVAMVADVVGKVARLGVDVSIQSGAGADAVETDNALAEAGATIVAPGEVDKTLSEADAIVSVRPLAREQASRVKAGTVCLSFLQPAQDTETISALAERGATAMSFDLIPRISRAQSMDALTSQALVSGYRVVLVGAELLPKFFPLFMTAAGTIPPAKVLVLGAGVAGLQAIATAKRLGAKVSAYDVRPASADEVKSMGGTFISLDLETAEGTGGYAKEMTADRAARQQELLTPYVADSDVIITTAAVPGRPAPRLVSKQMLQAMRPGAVVVDLASESGGNVEGSKPGEVLDFNGVKIWGGKDVPSQMPTHASRLYAMNALAVLQLIVSEGELKLDPEDEIVDGSAVVLNGEVRNSAAREALGLPALPQADAETQA